MITTIFKYQLEVTDFQTLRMPRSAIILCVQTQRGTPCLWAEVDPSSPDESRHIAIFGTGHDSRTPTGKTYIGTFQLGDGELVFHVFEHDRT